MPTEQNFHKMTVSPLNSISKNTSVKNFLKEAEQLFIMFAKKIEEVGGVVGLYNEFLRSMGEICEERLGSFFCIAPNFVSKLAKKFITEPMQEAIQTIKVRVGT